LPFLFLTASARDHPPTTTKIEKIGRKGIKKREKKEFSQINDNELEYLMFKKIDISSCCL